MHQVNRACPAMSMPVHPWFPDCAELVRRSEQVWSAVHNRAECVTVGGTHTRHVNVTIAGLPVPTRKT
jgi:hypothetical protein